MKITILYDNTAYNTNLQADWGFACLVEVNKEKILFDTGANGSILLNNMDKLGISPRSFNKLFISHDHWDHTGGITDIIRQNREISVYIPSTCSKPENTKYITIIKDPYEISENIYSTGELSGIEQSMVVKTKEGTVIITGCSHPGVGKIIDAASCFGRPYALIGGLHGFRDFELIKDLKIICPTHCTQFRTEITSLYPDKITCGGAGKIIEL